jgi:hypothetical protein
MEFALFAGLAFYLVPTFAAALREHERMEWVLILNVLLGWTLVGWCALLWWALRPGTAAGRRPRAGARLRALPGGRDRLGPAR